MSTFQQTEQLVAKTILTYDSGTTTTPGVKFTCPTGRYAELYILDASSAGAFLIRRSGNGQGSYFTSGTALGYKEPYLLAEGDTLETDGGNRDAKFFIKEYKNPS